MQLAREGSQRSQRNRQDFWSKPLDSQGDEFRPTTIGEKIAISPVIRLCGKRMVSSETTFRFPPSHDIMASSEITW